MIGMAEEIIVNQNPELKNLFIELSGKENVTNDDFRNFVDDLNDCCNCPDLNRNRIGYLINPNECIEINNMRELLISIILRALQSAFQNGFQFDCDSVCRLFGNFKSHTVFSWQISRFLAGGIEGNLNDKSLRVILQACRMSNFPYDKIQTLANSFIGPISVDTLICFEAFTRESLSGEQILRFLAGGIEGNLNDESLRVILKACRINSFPSDKIQTLANSLANSFIGPISVDTLMYFADFARESLSGEQISSFLAGGIEGNLNNYSLRVILQACMRNSFPADKIEMLGNSFRDYITGDTLGYFKAFARESLSGEEISRFLAVGIEGCFKDKYLRAILQACRINSFPADKIEMLGNLFGGCILSGETLRYFKAFPPNAITPSIKEKFLARNKEPEKRARKRRIGWGILASVCFGIVATAIVSFLCPPLAAAMAVCGGTKLAISLTTIFGFATLGTVTMAIKNGLDYKKEKDRNMELENIILENNIGQQQGEQHQNLALAPEQQQQSFININDLERRASEVNQRNEQNVLNQPLVNNDGLTID